MRKWMRFACALLAALWLAPNAAGAEIVPADEPDMHIERTITIEGKEVAVDAGVYGTNVKEVQAYSLAGLNLGSRPEEKIDLSVFLGDAEVEERRTQWTPEEVSFDLTDGSSFDIVHDYVILRRKTLERINNSTSWLYLPREKRFLTDYAEHVQPDELPDFSLDEAVLRLEPMLSQLGITAMNRPTAAASVTLEELNAAVKAHLDEGVSPEDVVIEDYTRDDEYYEIILPYLYHGLVVMPTSENLPYTNQFETPFAHVEAVVSRRCVEKLIISFVPGKEKASGKAFEPITVEEALAACEKIESTREYPWYDGYENPRIGEIRLGYAFLSKDRAITEVNARPAWLIYIFCDFKNEDGSVDTTWQTIAIDAQTGEMLLRW